MKKLSILGGNTTPSAVAVREPVLALVFGGTDATRNVKNFDKPVRDYYALPTTR